MDRQPDLMSALEQAWSRMVLVLFESFTLGKWLVLAFCAWLANLGRGGGGGGINCNTFSNLGAIPPIPGPGGPPAAPPVGPNTPQNWPTPPTPTPGPTPTPAPAPTTSVPEAPSAAPTPGPESSPALPLPDGSAATDAPGALPAPAATGSSGPRGYIEEILTTTDPMVLVLIAAAVLLGVAISIAIYLLIRWVSAHGRFMLIDGIVKNRGEVAEPWSEYNSEANSLTLMEIGLDAIGVSVLLVLGMISVALAWPDIASGQFTGWSGGAIAAAVITILPLVLLWSIAAVIIDHFVVPVMYARRVSSLEALRDVKQRLLIGQTGSVVLYFLLLIAMSIGIGMLGTAVGCIMCCVMWIPIVSSVISALVLLPIFVFMRAFSLHYIQQVTSDWQIFGFDNRCPACGYDLRGNPDATVCPECGRDVPPGQSGLDGEPARFAPSSPPPPTGPIV